MAATKCTPCASYAVCIVCDRNLRKHSTAADRHQKIYITLTIREVFLPDGEESYWAAFNDQGTKVAPWSDSDSPEEVKKKLVA